MWRGLATGSSDSSLYFYGVIFMIGGGGAFFPYILWGGGGHRIFPGFVIGAEDTAGSPRYFYGWRRPHDLPFILVWGWPLPQILPFVYVGRGRPKDLSYIFTGGEWPVYPHCI